MRSSTRRNLLKYLLIILVIAAELVGCGNKETGEVFGGLIPSPNFNSTLTPNRTATRTYPPTTTQTIPPTTTIFVPGPLFDANLDIKAGPVDVPLQLLIPSLNINIPVMGVGLTPWNVMDAPTGSVGSSFWYMAFWYRGSSIPGEVGTATIAGHITDPLGKPGAFRYLSNLKADDVIIIHDNITSIDMLFIVDEVRTITFKESSDPAILTLIFGAGPIAGKEPQPSLDGKAHLTLITCSPNKVTFEFDERTLIFATRIN
ncbi:MAG TPA: class F sortase [Anaerolineales bacterium]|nr:class F sortase [Anaerolineales bacterium]